MTEQERTDRFKALCGGTERANRLFRLYVASFPAQDHRGQRASREDVFRQKAKTDGFTSQQAEALLALQ